MRSILLRLLPWLWLAWGLAGAGEPPKEPMLRLDPGGHTAQINRIAADGAGRWLVTASDDKTARVWDLINGRLISVLRPPIGAGEEGKLYAVAISPLGGTVALGGWTGYEWDKSNTIYLFDRNSGLLVRRLTGLPIGVAHLAFSPDGQVLAATLGGNGGLRVFDAVSGLPLGEDRSYGGDSYSVQFSPDGQRLLTTSYDGQVRLYRWEQGQLSLMVKRPAPGGKEPYTARFSPDGRRIAVGFADTSAINVLGGDGLELILAPDTAGVNDSLGRVAWSADGVWLQAAGIATRNRQTFIRRWAIMGGRAGPAQDWPVAGNTIQDLVPLVDGRLAFGSSNPAWGLVDRQGQRLFSHSLVVADFRGAFKSDIGLSADGSQVSFGYERGGDAMGMFRTKERALLSVDRQDLNFSRLNAPGLVVSNWEDNYAPKLNGRSLKLESYERSRSLALYPDNTGLVLGTNWYLRAFDSQGRQVWEQTTPGAAWAVNISADGRWVVAAYADGTIRWHRAKDGAEQLALYPHPDKKRWVLWTPEGYYDASPGAEELIGWHLNQGKDREARFLPFGRLYDVFFRPDIVQAKFRGEDISSLVTLTAAEALKNPPPIPRFTQTPAASTTSQKERVCYQIASTGGGIGEVRLFQNGKLIRSDGFFREAARKADDKIQLAALDGAAIHRALRGLARLEQAPAPAAAGHRGDRFEDCLEVETLPGENEISLAAFNVTNSVQSNLETIRFTSNRKAEEPHLYVLGVGIDRYRDPAIGLQYAAKDAKDFQALMRDKAAGLFKPENIHIQGLSDAAATKEGIRQAFQGLTGQIKPWDSFILFVASHGVLLENQYYIVTAGFDGTLAPASLISSNEIVGLSKEIKALSQLFIFDTCHAGGVDNIVSGLYDARMSVMAKKMGLHIYASAGSVQEALDGYKGNGLFTHTLLKGMQDGGATDSNKDHQVSVIELGQRARQETSATSKTLGHPQTPYIINFGRDSPLFGVE